jgi:hypothetical protein
MARMGKLQGSVVQSRIIGVPNSIKRLKLFKKELGKGAQLGVVKALERLRKEVRKVTPIDTGLLRESIQIAITGSGLDTQGMLYCDDRTDYAIYVHEDLTKWHAPPTGAKFMQRTVWQNRAMISKMIADEARKKLKAVRGGASGRRLGGSGSGIGSIARGALGSAASAFARGMESDSNE